MDRIVREPECRQLTGLSRTTRWALERRGSFPARRRLSANTVGWLESELHAWIRTREARREGVPKQVYVRGARERGRAREEGRSSGGNPPLDDHE